MLDHPRLFSLGNIRKFVRYYRIYGLRNAMILAARKLRNADIYMAPTVNPLALHDLTAVQIEDEPPPTGRKISVVIPTKNAGNDFRFLLRKLKNQKGLKEIDIIVVDSGSTDETVATARDEGAEVLEIPPGEFSHSYSRNKGAERASGDFILFFVQDALPLSDRWLWEMATALEENEVAAVSCAEYPRSDCDLFYRCLMWNHYRSLHLDKDRVLAWDKSCSYPLGLRANAQISNIAALVRRDIFLDYRFLTGFAEDLDLGIRLIRDGHRIGFLHRTRVLHSHNRPAYYFLKRAYVDSKFQKAALNNIIYPLIRYPRRLYRDIAALYYMTQSTADELVPTTANDSGKLDLFMEKLKKRFMEDRDIVVPAAGNPHAANTFGGDDAEMEAFIQTMTESAGDLPIEYRCRKNMVVPHFLYHLDIVHAHLSRSREIVDNLLLQELQAALPKLAALHSGSHLAYLHISMAENGNREGFLSGLDDVLSSGV